MDALVGLSPPNHGATVDGLLSLLAAFPGGEAFVTSVCAACAEQAIGSDFMAKLNAGDDTLPGVRYTVIATKYDEVVTPYSSGFLSGSSVTNITLQDLCPADTSEHLRTPYDPAAIQITLNALGRSGPADPAFRPAC